MLVVLLVIVVLVVLTPLLTGHMTRPQRDFWKVFTNEGTPGALSEGYKVHKDPSRCCGFHKYPCC